MCVTEFNRVLQVLRSHECCGMLLVLRNVTEYYDCYEFYGVFRVLLLRSVTSVMESYEYYIFCKRKILAETHTFYPAVSIGSNPNPIPQVSQ
jgi:hypothetical protein